MGREIEFRCWYDNHMHKVNNVDFRHKYIDLYAADTINFEEGILMQYTGLKDKNGVKIFEGDIIIARDTKFIIKFGAYRTKIFEKEYGSAIHTKQYGWYVESIENKEQCNLVTPNGIEVIGNIYEKELQKD